VTFNAEHYQQFIAWLTDPERWTRPSFHLTDESHADELKEAVKRLRIEGNTEESLWLVFLDACVDNASTALELYNALGGWSSVKSRPLAPEQRVSAKRLLRRGLVGNHRERAFAKRGSHTEWVDRFAEIVEVYVKLAGSSQQQWLLGSWGRVVTENQGRFFDSRMQLLTHGASKLPTFGRTTAFDYLERVGRLGLLGQDFLPDRPYLKNSSGPLLGFSIVLTGLPRGEAPLKAWLRERGISRPLDEMANELQTLVLKDPRITSAPPVSEKPRFLVEILRDPRNIETSLCCFYEWGKKTNLW
jgi:hypothetical protein